MDSFTKLGLLLLAVLEVTSAKISWKDVQELELKNIKGKVVPFKEYSGKVLLIVNVASECGFTENHYKRLVTLQELVEEKGLADVFSILAFPCNQFGAQEPKSEAEIQKFVKQKYGVKFPVFSKIDVINKDAHKLYQYLAEQSGQAPNWNFWKYLMDIDGHILKAWGPWVDIPELTSEVMRTLEAVDNAQGPRRPTGNVKASSVPLDEEAWSEGFGPQNTVEEPSIIHDEI